MEPSCQSHEQHKTCVNLASVSGLPHFLALLLELSLILAKSHHSVQKTRSRKTATVSHPWPSKAGQRPRRALYHPSVSLPAGVDPHSLVPPCRSTETEAAQERWKSGIPETLPVLTLSVLCLATPRRGTILHPAGNAVARLAAGSVQIQPQG